MPTVSLQKVSQIHTHTKSIWTHLDWFGFIWIQLATPIKRTQKNSKELKHFQRVSEAHRFEATRGSFNEVLARHLVRTLEFHPAEACISEAWGSCRVDLVIGLEELVHQVLHGSSTSIVSPDGTGISGTWNNWLACFQLSWFQLAFLDTHLHHLFHGFALPRCRTSKRRNLTSKVFRLGHCWSSGHCWSHLPSHWLAIGFLQDFGALLAQCDFHSAASIGGFDACKKSTAALLQKSVPTWTSIKTTYLWKFMTIQSHISIHIYIYLNLFINQHRKI